MEVLGWIALGVVLVASIYYLVRRSSNPTRDAVQSLTRACGGDRDLAERLIFAEMQRDANLDMSAAAQRARRRLARDRR